MENGRVKRCTEAMAADRDDSLTKLAPAMTTEQKLACQRCS